MDHRPTAGFDAVTEFSEDPKPGQVMIVGNGGTVLFYVIGHDPAITRRLVEFLQQTDFAGVIFTRDPLDGTFTLEQGKIDPPSPGYGAAGILSASRKCGTRRLLNSTESPAVKCDHSGQLNPDRSGKSE